MRMVRLGRRAVVRLGLAAVLLLPAAGWLGWRGRAAPAAGAVTIADFAFGPATLTVPRGATVTWTNQDDEPHTVVSADTPASFKSPALDTDEHFSVTFDKPGTYKYFCSIHPRMQATVVVQ